MEYHEIWEVLYNYQTSLLKSPFSRSLKDEIKKVSLLMKQVNNKIK